MENCFTNKSPPTKSNNSQQQQTISLNFCSKTSGSDYTTLLSQRSNKCKTCIDGKQQELDK